jgi:hypothetical protein
MTGALFILFAPALANTFAADEGNEMLQQKTTRVAR